MQEKVKEGLSDQEEKLKELHKTIEEKSQRIADLEKELIEAPKKESKIFELEMEIEILQGIGMFSKVQTDLIHSVGDLISSPNFPQMATNGFIFRAEV